MNRLAIVCLITVLVIFFFTILNPNGASIVNNQAFFQVRKGGQDPRVEQMYREWRDCMVKNLSVYRPQAQAAEFWGNVWKGIQKCEQEGGMKDLKIDNFNNGDETKRHILPLVQEPSTIVTLGIGQDTKAEEAIKPRLPPNSRFYGADPIVDINEKLYTQFGSFFPFAVGAKPGMKKASVLINTSYVDKTVVTVDLVYLLKDVIGQLFYDDIWIDAEGAEYDLFPFFLNDGELDQNQITVCQFNMEVHLPTLQMKEQLHWFLWKVLDDERYAFFRPVQGYHLRLYFFNFNEPRCVTKYLYPNKPLLG